MPLLNVENARKNLRRYTWAQAILEGWKQQVAHLMDQNRDFIDTMMPALTPWPEYGQNCPACVNRLSSMGETGLYEWDPTDPDRLLCKYCKTEYPNANYPESGSITAPRMNQTFTFYLTAEERAHPEDKSGEHAFKWVNGGPYTRAGPASSAQKKAAGALNISCRLPNYTPSRMTYYTPGGAPISWTAWRGDTPTGSSTPTTAP